MVKYFPVDDGNDIISTRRYFIASLPDEKLGERLVLIVECPSIEDSVSRLLLEELKSTLPPREVPKEIRCVSRFIETPTHKIIRSAVLGRLKG
jgi:O-succinylbenzoic acid--CoA ligase